MVVAIHCLWTTKGSDCCQLLVLLQFQRDDQGSAFKNTNVSFKIHASIVNSLYLNLMIWISKMTVELVDKCNHSLSLNNILSEHCVIVDQNNNFSGQFSLLHHLSTHWYFCGRSGLLKHAASNQLVFWDGAVSYAINDLRCSDLTPTVSKLSPSVNQSKYCWTLCHICSVLLQRPG